MFNFKNCKEGTYLTKKGVNFPLKAKINVDHCGRLYFKENNSNRHYFSENFCCKAPTVEIGTTTKLLAGGKAFVKQEGDKENVTLNLGLVSGNIGPVGPIGETGDTGNPGPVTIVPFSNFSGLSSSITENSAEIAVGLNFAESTDVILSDSINDKITKSSIGDIFTFSTDKNSAFIIPRDGFITYINFSFNILIEAIGINNSEGTLITRVYISKESNYIFTPLNGTSTDVILSDSIINHTVGFLNGNSGQISIPVNQGDMIAVIVFITSTGGKMFLDGIISGGISLA